MDENVHKDFHGAMSFGLEFLERHYGAEGTEEFLSGLAGTVYRDLVNDLRERGIDALRDHWQHIFAIEEGEAEFEMEGETLVLRVHRCPAIHHMKAHGYKIAPHFCEHTRIVNDAICQAADYLAEVESDQSAGACVQRFRPVAGRSDASGADPA
jgi:hypothetical protein